MDGSLGEVCLTNFGSPLSRGMGIAQNDEAEKRWYKNVWTGGSVPFSLVAGGASVHAACRRSSSVLLNWPNLL